MRWQIRTLCWLFCGEFLLWSRGLMPPWMIFLIGVILTLRLCVIAVLPHYALATVFWLLTAVLFVLRYLWSFGSTSRRLRAHDNVPETGLPWPAFITDPRPAPTMIGQFGFEPAFAIALAYIITVQSKGILVLQFKLSGLLPPDVGLPHNIGLVLRPYLVTVDAWTRAHLTTAALL